MLKRVWHFLNDDFSNKLKYTLPVIVYKCLHSLMRHQEPEQFKMLVASFIFHSFAIFFKSKDRTYISMNQNLFVSSILQISILSLMEG